ncbi:MAG: hypothetical protein JRN26_00995 [Nitrososphaerota archaeon]|jgi:hypothetical protein|nr:hypothetical protein [Nitrososphaerota archaeon]MDG6930744.1 hypothetical protein [Nitrososphaerota archaeon]MDG6931820.1 hypothetical protein [Nitrososphaerota archaeon]MDG6935456.1 hypothetical protein [Nitrososphaerota archaeon]MDG6944346.1 hypothetical protein [Nitrososphaerota archaeon]
MNFDYQRYSPYVLFLIVAAFAYAFVTGKLTFFIHSYTVPAAIAFIGFIVFIFWIWSNIKPGWPGKVIDNLVFYGLQGGMYRRFDGLFVDISDLVNDTSLGRLKELILSDLNTQLVSEKSEAKKGEIQKTIEQISKLAAADLRKHFQVYGTRRDFSRYIWIWLADTPVDEWAFSSYYTSFSLPYGYVRRRAIFGVQMHLPHSIKMSGYGKVNVRVFVPLVNPGNVTDIQHKIDEEFVENVGLLGSAIRTAITIHAKVKEFEKRAKAYEKANAEKDKKIAELTIERDEARSGAAAKNLYEPTEDEKKPLGFGQRNSPIALLLASVFGTLIFGDLLPKYVKGLDPVSASMIGALTFGVLYLAFSNR